MLTHLTRRRAAAAVTRLTVVAAARIQITFRITLLTTYRLTFRYAPATSLCVKD